MCLAGLLAGVLSGAGTAGPPSRSGVAVSPSKLSFSRELVGSTTTKTVTVTNNTLSAIEGGAVAETGGGAAHFYTEIAGGCQYVEAGGSCEIVTYFAPTATGHHRVSFTVSFTTGPSQMTVSSTWSASGSAYIPKGGF
jgi:hypothetical protein